MLYKNPGVTPADFENAGLTMHDLERLRETCQDSELDENFKEMIGDLLLKSRLFLIDTNPTFIKSSTRTSKQREACLSELLDQLNVTTELENSTEQKANKAILSAALSYSARCVNARYEKLKDMNFPLLAKDQVLQKRLAEILSTHPHGKKSVNNP